ncbi:MAG: MFS transporter [Candidimonas sp.]|nr:MAG: MFS transporter [Candidimonas sp.]
MLVILLGAIDQTIVSVALPKMAADLGGVDLLAWVVSGYLITAAVAMPIYGKLGDLYGRRVMLSSAIAIFLFASLGSALAPSMPFLVGARIVQGVGGGGLISVAQAIIADVVAPRERGRYQGYISAAFAVASVSGPLLGGFLTSYLSWRWVFWINLPLGAAAMLISRRALVRLHTPRIRRPVDYLGAALMTVAISPFLIGVTRVGQGTPWLDETNLWLFGITLIAILAFLWQEVRTEEPLVPLGLFRNPTVSLSCVLMFIAFILIVSLSVLIPLRAQMLLGVNADQAALQLVPFSLGIPVGAFVGGRLSSTTGHFKRIQFCGAVCVPLAMLGLILADAHTLGVNLICVALIGVSIGVQLPTSTVAVQNAVAQRHMGIVTATIVFCRSLGAAVGIAVLMAVLMATLQAMAPTSAGSVTGSAIIKDLVDHAVALDAAMRGALITSVDGAFRKVFITTAALASVSILLSLLLRDDELSGVAPAAAD